MLPNGHAMARKGDLANIFAPGEFAAAQGGAPSAGAPLHVFFARESRTQQPGFYVANAETPAPFGADSRMTRIYWHIAEEGAVPLTHALTALLNRYQVPFRFKTLSYGGVYTRADAAVLYFAARYYQIVARLLPAIHEEVRNHLRPATPLLTRRLYDGVGLAEDPATGESFGMSRSRLIAQAIWDAYARGLQTEEARMMELALQFDRIGLSLDQPHLRAASADIYSGVDSERPGGRGVSALLNSVPAADPRERFLDVAWSIGTLLCRDAIWDGDRCNWLGDSMEAHAGEWKVAHKSFGPDLYSGTSGIALFLARLHRFRPDGVIAQTARGALRQALSRAGEVPAEMRHSLYSGWIGIALALLDAAELLDDPSLQREALRLVDAQLGHELDPLSLDVIGGAAGTVLGLAAIDRRLGGDRYLEEARRFGRPPAEARAPGRRGVVVDDHAAARRGAEGPHRLLAWRRGNRSRAARAVRADRRRPVPGGRAGRLRLRAPALLRRAAELARLPLVRVSESSADRLLAGLVPRRAGHRPLPRPRLRAHG